MTMRFAAIGKNFVFVRLDEPEPRTISVIRTKAYCFSAGLRPCAMYRYQASLIGWDVMVQRTLRLHTHRLRLPFIGT